MVEEVTRKVASFSSTFSCDMNNKQDSIMNSFLFNRTRFINQNKEVIETKNENGMKESNEIKSQTQPKKVTSSTPPLILPLPKNESKQVRRSKKEKTKSKLLVTGSGQQDINSIIDDMEDSTDQKPEAEEKIMDTVVIQADKREQRKKTPHRKIKGNDELPQKFKYVKQTNNSYREDLISSNQESDIIDHEDNESILKLDDYDLIDLDYDEHVEEEEEEEEVTENVDMEVHQEIEIQDDETIENKINTIIDSDFYTKLSCSQKPPLPIVKIPVKLAMLTVEADVFDSVELLSDLIEVTKIDWSIKSFDAQVILPSNTAFVKLVLNADIEYASHGGNNTLHLIKISIPINKTIKIDWLHLPNLPRSYEEEYMFQSKNGNDKSFHHLSYQEFTEKIGFDIQKVNFVFHDKFNSKNEDFNLCTLGSVKVDIDLLQSQYIDLNFR